MRARVIFRGLTLFVSERSTKGMGPNFNMGTLTALLVTDPKHVSMPLHNHTPYMGLIGRDHGDVSGPGRVETKRPVPAVTTIELVGYGGATGVTALESFLDYVPCLSDLHWDKSERIDESFVTRRIVIPSGTVRARDFITWDWHGNTPSEVAYMGTNFRGFAANEVIVDIAGDDLDLERHDPNKYLSVTGDGKTENLWPRAKGAASDEDIDPNTVELVFSNLPARRRRALPWGVHFETLVDAAGYPRRRDYENTPQYQEFVKAAMDYDSYEWQSDVGAMDIGQPFPFFTNAIDDRLAKLTPASSPAAPVYPIPAVPGRGKDEGIPTGGAMDHSSHGRMGGASGSHGAMGHDPANTVICPFGRE